MWLAKRFRPKQQRPAGSVSAVARTGPEANRHADGVSFRRWGHVDRAAARPSRRKAAVELGLRPDRPTTRGKAWLRRIAGPELDRALQGGQPSDRREPLVLEVERARSCSPGGTATVTTAFASTCVTDLNHV